ncbi:MAG: hypothetical protein AAF682_29835 [Planctomycetota bacterium]
MNDSIARERARRACLGLPLALALFAAPSGAQTLPDGTVIGELSLPAPAAEELVLHGVLPTRENMPLQGLMPLTVLDYDGTPIASTQVETVARFPGTDAPSAVEVLAKVRRNPAWTTGQQVRYQVIYDSTVTAPPSLPDDKSALKNGPEGITPLLAAWLDKNASLAVVLEDMLGNRYVSLPLRGSGGAKLVRSGPAKVTLQTYEVMEAFEVVQNPYPHALGVHAYVSTEAGEDVVHLDLRISNGGDGSDPAATLDDALGDIYFKSIEVWVRESFFDFYEDGVYDEDKRRWFQPQFPDPTSFQGSESEVVDLPWVGVNRYRIFPLVKPMPDGSAHLMRCRGRLIRRGIVSRYEDKDVAAAFLNQEGLGFATSGGTASIPYLSWQHPDTATFLGQHLLVPSLDFTNPSYGGLPVLRDKLSDLLGFLKDGVADDTEGFSEPHIGVAASLGYASPEGVPYGGQASGEAIDFSSGARTLAGHSRDGYVRHQLLHRRMIDRMPTALYGADGEPTGFEDLLVEDSGCGHCPLGPTGQPAFDPSGFNVDSHLDPAFCGPGSPWPQNDYVVQQGLVPAYAAALLNYDPHDAQHGIRATKDLKALAWIGNDPLAKDDLRLYAEQYRMSYTDFPKSGSSDTFTDHSLRYDQNFANAHPSSGNNMGRGEGWGWDAVASYFALADDTWRTRMQPWCDAVVTLLEDSITEVVDPAFVDDATSTPYAFGFVYAHVANKLCGGLPGDDRGRKPWEEMIVNNAMLAFARSVYADGSPERASLDAMLEKSLIGHLAPASWNESGNHVHVKLEASPYADPKPPVSATPMPLTIFCCESDLPGMCFPTTGLKDGVFYFWAAMGHAARLTGDGIFVEYAGMSAGVNCSGTAAACAAAVQGSLENKNPIDFNSGNFWQWGSQAVLLGAVQNW